MEKKIPLACFLIAMFLILATASRVWADGATVVRALAERGGIKGGSVGGGAKLLGGSASKALGPIGAIIGAAHATGLLNQIDAALEIDTKNAISDAREKTLNEMKNLVHQRKTQMAILDDMLARVGKPDAPTPEEIAQVRANISSLMDQILLLKEPAERLERKFDEHQAKMKEKEGTLFEKLVTRFWQWVGAIDEERHWREAFNKVAGQSVVMPKPSTQPPNTNKEPIGPPIATLPVRPGETVRVRPDVLKNFGLIGPENEVTAYAIATDGSMRALTKDENEVYAVTNVSEDKDTGISLVHIATGSILATIPFIFRDPNGEDPDVPPDPDPPTKKIPPADLAVPPGEKMPPSGLAIPPDEKIPPTGLDVSPSQRIHPSGLNAPRITKITPDSLNAAGIDAENAMQPITLTIEGRGLKDSHVDIHNKNINLLTTAQMLAESDSGMVVIVNKEALCGGPQAIEVTARNTRGRSNPATIKTYSLAMWWEKPEYDVKEVARLTIFYETSDEEWTTHARSATAARPKCFIKVTLPPACKVIHTGGGLLAPDGSLRFPVTDRRATWNVMVKPATPGKIEARASRLPADGETK